MYAVIIMFYRLKKIFILICTVNISLDKPDLKSLVNFTYGALCVADGNLLSSVLL